MCAAHSDDILRIAGHGTVSAAAVYMDVNEPRRQVAALCVDYLHIGRRIQPGIDSGNLSIFHHHNSIFSLQRCQHFRIYKTGFQSNHHPYELQNKFIKQ